MSTNVHTIHGGAVPEDTFDIELRDWIAQKLVSAREKGGHIAGIACVLLEVTKDGDRLGKSYWFFDAEHEPTMHLRAHFMASQLQRDTLPEGSADG